MTSMKRVCQAVLLSLALGAGAAPSYSVADPRPVDPFVPGINEDPQLAAAWQDWQSRGVDDYVLAVQRRCFCPPSAAVRTVVRDDAIVKVTQGERRLRPRKGWSMDGLFIMLREALAEADSVDVQFTPRGVPKTIAVDPERTVADEETYYTVALSRR
ncbi:exported hypothetical protein [metagenome]|uniref:Uncharacterized protein n=1 Tax=metagenome TaxID=256318 RepID=A0A2P2CGU0_9ZZZZ